VLGSSLCGKCPYHTGTVRRCREDHTGSIPGHCSQRDVPPLRNKPLVERLTRPHSAIQGKSTARPLIAMYANSGLSSRTRIAAAHVTPAGILDRPCRSISTLVFVRRTDRASGGYAGGCRSRVALTILQPSPAPRQTTTPRCRHRSKSPEEGSLFDCSNQPQSTVSLQHGMAD
jgi:hypothetical protein